VDQQLRRSNFIAGKLLLDLRQRALESAKVSPDARPWAEQLMHRARSSELLGELDHADGFAAETIACAENNGYDDLLPRALRILGNVRRQKGDLESAWTLLHRAIELSDASGDLETLATSVLPVADMARRAGDLEGAFRLIERGERAASRSDNPLSSVNFIALRALIALHAADYDVASALFSEAALRYTEIGSTLGVANCTKGRGDVQRHVGRFREARELYLDALGQYRAINAGDAVIRLDLLLLDVAERKFAEAQAGLDTLIDELEADSRQGFAEYVRVALLPCLCAAEAWDDFQRVLDSTTRLLASGRVLEPDVALSLEAASKVAYERGASDRGQGLAALAAEVWGRLGQLQRAQALRGTF
jgi:tetratricopeptide (TPR) repeat protein